MLPGEFPTVFGAESVGHAVEGIAGKLNDGAA